MSDEETRVTFDYNAYAAIQTIEAVNGYTKQLTDELNKAKAERARLEEETRLLRENIELTRKIYELKAEHDRLQMELDKRSKKSKNFLFSCCT